VGKRYDRIAAALLEQPWAIVPSAFEAIAAILERRIKGIELSADEIAAKIGDRERPSSTSRVGSVAVLALHGPISQRLNMFSAISGGTSTEIFGRDFDAAIADPDVAAIVLSIDSPGGSVSGVAELADKIFKARGSKPIVVRLRQPGRQRGVLDRVAGRRVRRVAVIAGRQHRRRHVASRLSKAEDAMGVKTTVIAIPAAKAEAHPYQPLSEDALEGVLASMQPFYDLFTKAVARGRGVSASDVKNGYGQGRVLAAVPAKGGRHGRPHRITFRRHRAAVDTAGASRRAHHSVTTSAPDATTDQEPSPATSQESRPRVSRGELFTADLIELENRK
jgi:hypothetical protein